MPATPPSSRSLYIAGMIVAVFLIILVRLFLLQVVDQTYKLSASSNVLRRITQYPARGLIFDRHGELLVSNQAAYDLMVVPHQLRPFDTTALRLLLGLTHEQMVVGLREAKRYSRFKPSIFLKQISATDYAVLQEKLFQFPGFYVQPRTLRYYPRPMAAHVLGYVGEVDNRIIAGNPYYAMGDYIGISGLERSYEPELRGRKGVRMFLVDVHNRIKGAYAEGRYDTASVQGQNLITTIDAALQEYGERLMQNKVGSIVALEPATGQVLAMVTSPVYNPNLLVGRPRTAHFRALDRDTLKPLFNRSLMALYPPGSTFKMVNGLIGLQEGVLTPSMRYRCDGAFRVGRGVACRPHPSPTNLVQSIQVSCNTFYCHVFRNIIDNRRHGGVEGGFTSWRNHLESFGFGRRLNIDLPNELAGNVPTIDFYNRFFRRGGWSSLTIISLAIGQGELGTTPLQMANLAAIIANRGHFYTPHLVKGIGEVGNIDPRFRVRHQTTVDSAWFEYAVEGMYQTVNAPPGSGSTGRVAAIPGQSVCGKTGTSQNPHGENHSVFIAFAPRDNPRIAIAVYVENAGYGSVWAAPIASLMMERYLTDTITRPCLEQRMLEANLLDRRGTKR